MPTNEDTVLNFKFSLLQTQLRELRERNDDFQSKAERSGIAFTGRIYDTIADAPLAADGNTDFAFGFIRSGRKSGEGVGNGTGVFAMFDPATDSWLDIGQGYIAVTE